MKISDRDKILILAVVFLAIVLLPIFLFIRPKIESIKGLDSELVDLNKRYDYLKQLSDKQPTYEAEIERLNTEREQMIADFSEGILQENTIMFLYDIETTFPIKMEREEFTPVEETFVTAGTVQNGEVVGDLTALKYSTKVTYKATGYDQLKKLLEYIFNNEKKMAISAINITFDAETAAFEGYFVYDEYAFVGSGRNIDSVQLPSLDRGNNQNIFKRVMPAPTGEDAEQPQEEVNE